MTTFRTGPADLSRRLTARAQVGLAEAMHRRRRGLPAGVEGPAQSPDRGDVPGWVLVTLMSAGLVTTLWTVAGQQLQDLFTTAIQAVTGPGAGR